MPSASMQTRCTTSLMPRVSMMLVALVASSCPSVPWQWEWCAPSPTVPASFLFGDLCSKRNQTGTEVSETAARAELSMPSAGVLWVLCAGRLSVSGQKSNELAPWIRAEIGLLFGSREPRSGDSSEIQGQLGNNQMTEYFILADTSPPFPVFFC